MEVPTSSIITPALIGIVSTLITLVLTPRLHHHFWGYQRMSELRLGVFKQVNDLAAEFLNNYLNDQEYRPSDDFFRVMLVATANVKILFSQRAVDRFKQVEPMIGPNLGPTGRGSVDAFVETLDAALRALYSEAVAVTLFQRKQCGLRGPVCAAPAGSARK